MASAATGGSEITVDADLSHDQTAPSQAALADGGWIVTWTSDDGATEGVNGVYFQRYAADGTIVGDATRIDTDTANNQQYSQVIGLEDGGWVIVWAYANQDGSSLGIYQQRYSADGSTAGAMTHVSTYVTGDQFEPSATALADGGWVVAWTSAGQDGSAGGVFQQRFQADGGRDGEETQVNTYTASIQWKPTITALSDGGWVATWTSYGQDGGFGGDIIERRFDANGNAMGEEIFVNTDRTADHQFSSATSLADGGWLVAWESSNQDGSGSGIYQQRFDSTGAKTGGEVLVNTTTDDYQTNASVTGLADGGWVAAWESGVGGDYNVYMQRYDADGRPVGSETVVNAVTPGGQYEVSVTALSDGGWIVSWESGDTNGNGLQIHQRHFAPDIIGTQFADTLEGTDWDEMLVGYAGNDTLDGGKGDDVLIGGYGNDTYMVNSDGDKVQELTNQGTDIVYASVDYTLAGSIEKLVLTGTALSAIGNALANTVLGNDSANKLYGMAGDDRLSGGAGNDTLVGGAGADIMSGGAGNDAYYVDNAGDQAVEAAGAGTDIVYASVTLSLGSNVENLTLTGTGTVNGIGNTLANVLRGNTSANRLSGLSGNDGLYGGAGTDVLTGGLGADTFHFATGDTAASTAAADTITDFSTVQNDIIDLSAIDANEATVGNQAFTFIGSAVFSHVSGQLRLATSNGDAYVLGDTDGDGKADFTIHLDGIPALQKGDIIL